MYNEERNVAQVLSRVPEGIDVVVVDDGSKDGTSRLARSYGARVIRHPINMGQGMAFITGVYACLLEDYDVIVHVDGDGQHDPREIPNFLSKMEETGADIVIGSRILGSNYEGAPYFRRTFLPYVTWLINKLTGYQMTDAMSGFRAHRAESLRRVQHIFTQMDEPQYMAAEMFIRFSRQGLKIAEVPIKMDARMSGVSHKGRDSLDDLLRYGLGVTKAILKTLF